MSYKVIPPGKAAELTISLEEGLLLPCNPLTTFIIEAAMARAQHLHPVKISHYLVEPSHVHFLTVVEEPGDIPGFAGRFKTESAHYINAMLGRKKRTVWCEDYFCAPVLTLSSAIKKISYIYTNPAKDGLEDSIDLYPGLSSWKAYRSRRLKRNCPRLHRPMIPHLPEKFYKKHTYKRHRRELRKRSKNSHPLTLSPDLWMETFGITDVAQKERVNEQVLQHIREEEEGYRQKRKESGRGVIGQQALSAAHLDTDYVPKERTGKKMWCICDDPELRKKFIAWAKSLKQEARDVYERWKLGDYMAVFPPGVFPPAMPKLSNMMRQHACC